MATNLDSGDNNTILCYHNVIALLLYTARLETGETGELLAHMEIISVLIVSVNIRIKSCLFFSYLSSNQR